MSKCIVCLTEIVLNENGECSYCAESKKQAEIFAKEHPHKLILTAENYFSQEANQAYMSVSQFKDFQKCEAMAMAKLRGEWQQEMTTALLVGSYVDAYFEGTLSLFLAHHPELLKKDGTLKSDYLQANQIITKIESDPVFMFFMLGEKQTIMTAPLLGCEWKIKIDVYDSRQIVDLKIMRSLEPVMGKSFIEHWMYDLQMAVYSKIEQTFKKRENPVDTYLAVATKEDYTDLEIVDIPLWRREECLVWLEKQMPRVLDVKSGKEQPKRCGICDYCKASKVLTGPVDFQDVGISYYELSRMKGEY